MTFFPMSISKADAAMKMRAEDAFLDAVDKIEIFNTAIHKTLVDSRDNVTIISFP